MTFRLLDSSLLLLRAHAVRMQELSRDTFVVLDAVLQQFVKAWVEQEECRKQQDADKEALYEWKDFKQSVRVNSLDHGEKSTLEEDNEAAFCAAFPSYREVKLI